VPGSLEHLYPEVKGPTRMVHGMVDGSSVPSTHQPVAAEG
jgi:hypothetical protein